MMAVDAGILFVTATGRSFGKVGIVNDFLEKDMPFAVFNGASIIMGKSQKLLSCKYLGISSAREVFEIGLSRGIPQMVWAKNNLFTSIACDYTKEYIRLAEKELVLISDLDQFDDESIHKILWINPTEKTKSLHHELGEHFGDKLNCHPSSPIYLEFVSPTASKGNAIAEIGNIYGIDKSEMIAIGDNYNDISMLQYAGLGIAMGNAPNDIKDLCDHVTCSNDDSGVADVIEKFILRT
jgi:Cof subfamily protein (haloacid dehalogenase superfamily)